MLFPYLCIYLLGLTSCVQASHFRGGYISWQVVSPNITNSSTVTISLQQTYSWANSVVPCGQSIGDARYLVCISSNCSNYANTISVTGPCISYDLGLDVSTAQKTTSLTLLAKSQLVLAFQSTNWLPLVYGISFPSWSLLTYINLAVRTDNGQINSSPTSGMAALVNVLINSQQTLRIPVADIDLDVIKCRWATNNTLIGSTTVNECGDVCRNMPSAQLYSTSNADNNCTLVFTATIGGYYAIALQIEDFMPSNPNDTALSSIPLQFLVRALNISCNAPTIIGELANGATVQLQPNITFTVSIIAQTGCNGTSITRFSTITIPSGMASTSTIIPMNSSLYAIIFIWTPNINQIGAAQLYCTMAIANNNLQSAQYCLNFVVALPTTTTSTSTTTNTMTTTSTTIASTTNVMTAITSAASVIITTASPVTNQSNNTLLIIGPILGIGLPLLFILFLLSCFCCCRYCNYPFCYRFRQRFCREKNVYCSVCHGQTSGNMTTNNNPRQHRTQYINDQNPFELGPMTSTTATFVSQSSNRITPIDCIPSKQTSILSRSMPMVSDGSILIEAFTKQEEAKGDLFN